jgi:3-phenylpropionate/cinnamic acid dioxygenase small subunit
MAADRPPAERQIANLVYGLAEALDDGDHDRIEALLGEATFQLGERETRVGGAAFRRTVERSMILYEDGTPRTLHVVSNLTIEVDDDTGTATSKSYVTVFQGLPDFPLQAVLTGRYLDSFACDSTGTWRWRSRRMRIDQLGDTSRHTNTNL